MSNPFALYVTVHQARRARRKRQNKVTAINSSLYFSNVSSNVSSGGSFDGRETEYGDGSETGDEVAVVQAAGQAYTLLKLNRYIVFRPQSQTDERDALFLTRQFLSINWRRKVKDFAPVMLATELAAGAFGRVLLYQADCMTQYQAAYLLFYPNGTGYAMGCHEENWTDFRWNDQTPLAWPELLAADPESLRPLCDTIFHTQLNPRMPNPYIDPDSLDDIPHVFECGSEDELRRLTVAIVQSEPGLWDDTREPVRVMYRARTPQRRGCLKRVDRPYEESVASGRLHSLCDLAHRLNMFTGVEYKAWAEEPNRRGHFQKDIRQIIFKVPPPSRHEQAESLLIVGDWLEGKVRPDKRLRLLGLEASDLS